MKETVNPPRGGGVWELCLTLENGSKGLHTVWNKIWMKKGGDGRILGAPDDENFVFRQRFLLLFLRLAKNQWSFYSRISWIHQIKVQKIILLKHLKICDFFNENNHLKYEPRSSLRWYFKELLDLIYMHKKIKC